MLETQLLGKNSSVPSGQPILSGGAKRRGMPPKYPPGMRKIRPLGEPRMGKGRTMHKVEGLDYGEKDFGGFLEKNFNGSLPEFCKWLRCATPDTCHYIHLKYENGMDGIGIIAELGWSDVLAITKIGAIPFGRMGANLNNLLGFGMPPGKSNRVESMQAEIMKMCGSLDGYLAFREGASFTTAEAGFIRLFEDAMNLKHAGMKNAFANALCAAFGKEIEAKMAPALIMHLGWEDPIKIMHGGQNCPKNRGYFVSRIFGMKIGGDAGEALRNGGNAQEYVFRRMYHGMQDYLGKRHGGSYEKFGEEVMAIKNQPARRAFCDAFWKAFAKEIALQETKIGLAGGFGMLDPLDAYLKTGTDDGWARMLALIRIFGWQLPKEERLDGEVRSTFFTKIARLHGDFDAYLKRCYRGDAKLFAKSLLERASGEFKTHFTRRLKMAFGKLDSVGRHQNAFTEVFFGRNPFLVKMEIVRERGAAFANLAGLRTPLRMPDVLACVFRAHGTFDEYLKEFHGGSLVTWLGAVEKLNDRIKTAYLSGMGCAYPYLRDSRCVERKELLSQLSYLDPLLFGISRKASDGRNYIVSKKLAITRVFGSGKHSDLEFRAILLSRFEGIGGYIAEYHGGDADAYLRIVTALPPIKRYNIGRAMLLAFTKMAQGHDAAEIGSISGDGGICSAVPEKVSSKKAKELFFDPEIIGKTSYVRIPGKKGLKSQYSYRELAEMWISDGVGCEADEPALAKAMPLFAGYGDFDGKVARKAVEVAIAKTRQGRRAEFVEKHLPEIMNMLEGFFGNDTPHALAVLARMKKYDDREDNYSFVNEWQTIEAHVRDYIRTIVRNRQIILQANDFEKQDNIYLRRLESRNYQVTAVYDEKALEIAFFVDGERVAFERARHCSIEKTALDDLWAFFGGGTAGIAPFADAMGMRLGKRTAVPSWDIPVAAGALDGD